MMVSNRDSLVQMRTIHENENQSYRISVSIDDDAFPDYQPNSGYVRMNAKLSAWAVSKKKDGELDVWYFNHTDPSGYIPAWIVNSRLTDGSLSALKCKKIIEKN
jgi:hypothetical protein